MSTKVEAPEKGDANKKGSILGGVLKRIMEDRVYFVLTM